MTNSAYFRSLEQMLKNLEFVRCSMEQAEQRLSAIVARSGRDRDGRHETAALLLSAGEKPAKIAAMLNLPLHQVKRACEPQRPALKGRKSQAQKSAPGQSAGDAQRPHEPMVRASKKNVSASPFERQWRRRRRRGERLERFKRGPRRLKARRSLAAD